MGVDRRAPRRHAVRMMPSFRSIRPQRRARGWGIPAAYARRSRAVLCSVVLAAAPAGARAAPPRPARVTSGTDTGLALAPPETCTPAAGDATALLAHAADRAGFPRDGRVLRYAFRDDIAQDYQSDRPYPPYLTAQWGGAFYADPAARVQRLEERMFGFGGGAVRPIVLLHGERSTYVVRDTVPVASPGGHALSLRSRPLDAWTTIADWRAAPDARVVARCVYRDYPRIVLARTTLAGGERLYFDPKSGLPVKLDRREPHAFWKSCCGPCAPPTSRRRRSPRPERARGGMSASWCASATGWWSSPSTTSTGSRPTTTTSACTRGPRCRRGAPPWYEEP